MTPDFTADSTSGVTWDESLPVPASLAPLLESLHLDTTGTFGDATHPTTQLLLTAVCARARPGLHLLDAGCGSGILTLAAARLGAHAHGIDLSPTAITRASDNRRRAHVPERVPLGARSPLLPRNAASQQGSARFTLADATSPLPSADHSPRYDLIAANLFTDTLLLAAPHLAARLRPRATLLLTGLLLPHAARCERALSHLPALRLTARTALRGWALLTFESIESIESIESGESGESGD